MHPRISGWLLAATLALAPRALAQLERVEAGFSDVSSLSEPRRVLPVDLREPVGFDAVYRLTRHGPAGDVQSFARANGGITAVFPRSVYVPTRAGWSADIPPGTVFYIGEIPDAGPGPGRSRPAFNRAEAASSEPPVARGILSDEAYRCRRVDELMRTAVVGGNNSPGGA